MSFESGSILNINVLDIVSRIKLEFNVPKAIPDEHFSLTRQARQYS